jgi:hypothetical protein
LLYVACRRSSRMPLSWRPCQECRSQHLVTQKSKAVRQGQTRPQGTNFRPSLLTRIIRAKLPWTFSGSCQFRSSRKPPNRCFERGFSPADTTGHCVRPVPVRFCTI